MRSSSAGAVMLLAAMAVACGPSGPAPVTYTLGVSIFGIGTVNGSPSSASCQSSICTPALEAGTQVTLTAVPAPGSAFSGWTGACNGAGSCHLTLTGNASVTARFSSVGPSGANALPLSVNGAACGNGSMAYPNKPCVQVTVCVPGTANCAVVEDVLVDTGSYGLRLFKQALPISLPLVVTGSTTMAECVQFLDGASDWGPLATADVLLGGEPAMTIPVHVIDSTFGHVPTGCPNPETAPAVAGFQAILGVGPFAEDCGSGCASVAANGMYFACTASTCTGTTVPLASQVPNPVARLPVDNNGIIVSLPLVSLGGVPSVDGELVLGIDTQGNNASTGATAYPADPSTGLIRTTFDGAVTGSFLDTGSNGLFFSPPASGVLPACAAPDMAWFCPAQMTFFTATNSGIGGSPSRNVSFSIGNASILFNSSNGVFQELGGPAPAGSSFDFGLPFFLGQKVFVGIDLRTSGLGQGPYFAS